MEAHEENGRLNNIGREIRPLIEIDNFYTSWRSDIFRLRDGVTPYLLRFDMVNGQWPMATLEECEQFLKMAQENDPELRDHTTFRDAMYNIE